jgi:hypothetical protein
MTPKIMLRTKNLSESEENSLLSQELFTHLESAATSLDLTPSAPLFTLEHPGLIKTKILHHLGKLTSECALSHHGYYFEHYQTQAMALNHHCELSIVRGFPFEVFRLLEKSNEALLDFDHLGVAYLSRTPLLKTTDRNTLSHHLLSQWLDYALSPELWGVNGKWTRFHARLHDLFIQSGLLMEKDYPGCYILKPEGAKLTAHGFMGLSEPDRFQLVLPWDFSLSNLITLERLCLS